MRNLVIGDNNIFIPNINLDAQSGYCEISGESYPEEAELFYQDIVDWIKNYFAEVDISLNFDFKLTYFNTTSFKGILKVLKCLKQFMQKGHLINVNWYYPDDDFDLLAEAEDLSEGANIDINLIPYRIEY